MQLPQFLWNREGRIPKQINLVWERITASRVTIAYFVFSVVHCLIQVSFQSHAFVVNKRAADGLASVIERNPAAVPLPGFLVLGEDLRLCEGSPDDFSTSGCDVIWNSTINALPIQATPSAAIALEGSSYPPLESRQLAGESVNGEQLCLKALHYPVMILRNTKREDAAFISFHIWVLGMSIVALLNESVPHILASFFTHVAATAWAGFQIYSTEVFRKKFNRLILNGACRDPLDLVPSVWTDGYWTLRRNSEVPILAFNVAALFLSAFMTWKLLKAFGWQTFKRVGASRSVNRLYSIVLTLSIVIQLSLFFMAVTLATWIDQLANGSIARLADYKTFYQILFILTLITLIPWLVTGWIAVRQERRGPMLIFLVLSIWFFAGFGGMFLATSFRWTFMMWSFFGVMASLSVIFTLTAFVLGLVCWRNFGRGLKQQLVVEEALAGHDFVTVMPNKGDIEKVAFPVERPLPTYSAAFDTRRM